MKRCSKSVRFRSSNVAARFPLQSPIGSEEPIGDSFSPGEAFGCSRSGGSVVPWCFCRAAHAKGRFPLSISPKITMHPSFSYKTVASAEKLGYNVSKIQDYAHLLMEVL